jgi:hypothetical protein
MGSLRCEASPCLTNDVDMCVGFGSTMATVRHELVMGTEAAVLNSDFLLLILKMVNAFFSGVDSVGTVSASLVTYASIQALKPDLIINAGTAGGFKVCFVCKDHFDCFVFLFLGPKSSWGYQLILLLHQNFIVVFIV